MEENKPYNSLSDHLKEKLGSKTVKLSVNAGFTCPNRDGKISTGGCIFCSGSGSGDFAPEASLSISEQLRLSKEKLSNKWPNAKYIAYFQAFTNTYAPLEVLEKKYNEALSCDYISGIAIATRPDCIDDDIAELLSNISKKTYLWVEFGLQTSDENTAKLVNRGYTNDVYLSAMKKMKSVGIETVSHIILGLPHETRQTMLNTVKFAANAGTDGIKLQLLHIIRDTKLEEMYNKEPFHVMTKEEYTDTVIDCIEHMPPNIVIHRLTGDGNRNELIEPQWSMDKRGVLNEIQRKMKINQSFQGKLLNR
ncbi:MAG: TIGR01212 family radical SAM protein [Candidatus Metalachnospira sp.]|nr:TIGR01212 family radical SAM protein [Candidatus Metalachnospira sp.]